MTGATAAIERLAIRYDDGSINVLTTSDLAAARRERGFDDGSLSAEILRVRVNVLDGKYALDIDDAAGPLCSGQVGDDHGEVRHG